MKKLKIFLKVAIRFVEQIYVMKRLKENGYYSTNIKKKHLMKLIYEKEMRENETK